MLHNTENEAIGRSKGGLTTKIHLLCNAKGETLAFQISEGQRADVTGGLSLLELMRSARRPKYLIADRAYDAYEVRAYSRERRIRAVIPEKRLSKHKKRRRRGRIPSCPKEIYASRNEIEREVGRLKDFRRIAMRYEKYAHTFAAFFNLGLMFKKVRKRFPDRA